MRICALTPEHVRIGGAWLIPNLDEELLEHRMPLEQLSIIEQEDEDIENLTDEDNVAYVGLSVTDSGRVTPLVLVREIGPESGGDYCECVDGKWRQVGLVPNPDAEICRVYFRQPLPQDPGFDSDSTGSYRRELVAGFDKWIKHI